MRKHAVQSVSQIVPITKQIRVSVERRSKHTTKYCFSFLKSRNATTSRCCFAFDSFVTMRSFVEYARLGAETFDAGTHTSVVHMVTDNIRKVVAEEEVGVVFSYDEDRSDKQAKQAKQKIPMASTEAGAVIQRCFRGYVGRRTMATHRMAIQEQDEKRRAYEAMMEEQTQYFRRFAPLTRAAEQHDRARVVRFAMNRWKMFLEHSHIIVKLQGAMLKRLMHPGVRLQAHALPCVCLPLSTRNERLIVCQEIEQALTDSPGPCGTSADLESV